MRWLTAPLGTMASCRTSNVDKKSYEGERPVRLVNYTDVYYGDRITADADLMSATASDQQFARLRVETGDVIITKDSETADDIAVPAVIDGEDGEMVCGYHLCLVRPDASRLDARYLYWTLSSRWAADYWKHTANGVTRFALGTGPIGRFPVPVLPVSAQRRIADYLDAETAQIDGMLAELDLLVKALDGRFRRRRVELIPANGMNGAPLATLCSMRAGGTPATSDMRMWTDSEDEGTPWVAIGDMSGSDEVRGWTRRVTEIGLADKRLPVGQPGTVLFAMYASVGEVAVLPFAATWNQAILGMTPVQDLVDARYFVHALKALQPALMNWVRSNTQNNLNAEIVRALRVPLPPLEDQLSITSELDFLSQETSAMIADANRLKELLIERRAALITDVITGKKEVA